MASVHYVNNADFLAAIVEMRAKKKEAEENEEEIQYRTKNAKLVYVKITGDIENYKIGLGKKEN